MKTTTLTALLTLGLIGWAGCTKKPADDSKGTKAPVMSEVKQPKHLPKAYACQKDNDCQRTCAQGIVNKDWYSKNEAKLEKCKDGCAGPRPLDLKCVKNVCTGYTKDGKVDKYCTRHVIRWTKR